MKPSKLEKPDLSHDELTVSEVMDVLHVPRCTVLNAIYRKQVPAFKIQDGAPGTDHRWWIPKESLKMIKSRKVYHPSLYALPDGYLWFDDWLRFVAKQDKLPGSQRRFILLMLRSQQQAIKLGDSRHWAVRKDSQMPDMEGYSNMLRKLGGRPCAVPWLKPKRLKAHLTQRELAAYVGVSQPSLCNWERGVSEPDEETAKQLTELLDNIIIKRRH